MLTGFDETDIRFYDEFLNGQPNNEAEITREWSNELGVCLLCCQSQGLF